MSEGPTIITSGGGPSMMEAIMKDMVQQMAQMEGEMDMDDIDMDGLPDGMLGMPMGGGQIVV